MSERGRPPAVRRYLWGAVVWPLLAIGVFGSLFLFEDLQWSRPHELDASEESRVVGVAVVHGEAVKVRYRHPVTEQTVVAPLWAWDPDLLPEPGEQVHLTAQNDDPLSVQVEGDRFPATENLFVYSLWIVAASVPLVGRRFSLWTTERLAAGPDPTFAMLGTLVPSGFLGRCHLQLFALDAPAGAEPLCAVRVLTTAHAPLVTRTFPVEVKGSPRPFGRVVAQTGGAVLWPAGRALGRRKGRAKPAAVGGPPIPLESAAPRAATWSGDRRAFFARALAATGAAALLFVIVSGITLRNAGRANEVSREGLEVVGEVIRHEGDDDIVVLQYQRDGLHTTRARVDFASDYPIGIRYPIRIDPDDRATTRLVTEPYDVVEPHVWGGTPLAAAALWLFRRWRTWRRIRHVATEGPWWHADAIQLEHDGRSGVLGVAARDDVIAGIPVGPLPAGATLTDRNPVIVAGDLESGGPAAVWLDGAPLTSLGRIVIPELHSGVAPGPGGDGMAASARSPIPLRTYRLAPRKARLDVAEGTVSMYIPAWFGRRRWKFRIADIAPVDLTSADTVPDSDPPEGAVVPYMPTTSPLTEPTLLLVFSTPQRVPPIRLGIAMAPNLDVPFGYRQSRSEEGAYADGVLLRAVDAATAVRTLVEAGATNVSAPWAWLAARRPELSQPAFGEGVRRRRVLRRAGVAAMVGGWAALVFGQSLADWLWAPAFGLFALGLGVSTVARRLERRSRRRGQAA